MVVLAFYSLSVATEFENGGGIKSGRDKDKTNLAVLGIGSGGRHNNRTGFLRTFTKNRILSISILGK